MCGITGAVPGIDSATLSRMTAKLAHRGPDGTGYFCGPHASLGHRRLAVIDLVTGEQPMSTADGRYTIAFNGEIYNFRELRRELESLGCAFRTQSDTEVLLSAYAHWGREALEKLRGMFAFAVWDAHRQRLFLARDRLGVKPLYYCQAAGRLFFASEIKALLAHPDVPRRFNAAAVDDYLTYLYIGAPQTIFAGICELPPASWLLWENGFLDIGCYWDARPVPADGVSRGEAESRAEELRDALAEAVRLRLVSDVPLGAFLSGGVDSSTIVALMAQSSGEAVRSFSLGFRRGEEHYSELPHARVVAQRFGARHTELEIRPDCAALLPAMVAQFDEPFGNPTALLIHQLSDLTRRHVTVALAGDGGDELFLGYPRYLGVRLRRWLDAAPRPLRAALGAAADVIPDRANGHPLRRRAREFLSSAPDSWQAAYQAWVTYFSPAMRSELYTPEFQREVGEHDSSQALRRWFARAGDADPADQASYADLHTFLPFNLLEYGDRMSMAHGLEVRLPFTDYRLVEFAMRVPAALKLRGRHGKALLRRAARPLLPDSILARPKLGLNPPMPLWLRHELAPLVEQYLSHESLLRRGWFRPEAVARLLQDFRSGRRDYSLHIWSLLVLEEWCRQYLDGETPGTAELAPAASASGK